MIGYDDTDSRYGSQDSNVVFSPNGRFFAMVGSGRLQFADSVNRQLIRSFGINADVLALHPSGLLLATTKREPRNPHDRVIELWRLHY